MIFNSGFQIEVLEGADRGKKIPLKSKELTLGRKLIPNERITHWILFNEPTVSRIHAVLLWNDETKIYNIHHKSKTNPTLVNTVAVDKKEIIQGDTIQMGFLVFKVTHESTSLESSAETEKVDFSFLLEKDERPPDGSLYYLEVTEGDDRGKTFPLIATRHVLGRLQGEEDAREHEILLNEHYIPEEHIFLNWNSRENKYGAIKSEHSLLISQVRRANDTMETVIDITTERQVLLEEGDELLVGTSVLRVRKGNERAVVGEESASKLSVQMSGRKEAAPLPMSFYSEEEEDVTLPPVSASEEEVSPSPPPAAGKEQNRPQELSIVMEESMKLKSIPLDATERPGINFPASDEDESPSPQPPEMAKEETGITGEPVKGVIEPDYELSIMAGPDRGNHVSFLRRDLREGRSIRLGRRQCIFNDIQLQDERIGDLQATILFKRGRFYVRNDNMNTLLYLNGDPVSSHDETEISSGDTLTCGDTVMILRDKRDAFRPGDYALEVVEGMDSERGKIVDITRETVTIGRAAHCDIVLSDPDIKPIHAAITCQNASFILQQLSEVGVLYLNGISTMIESPRELHPGDLVRLSPQSSLIFSRKQR